MRLNPPISPEPPDDLWSWLNANGGTITTIATVITALVAIGALIAAARDSRERSRPYLAAELFPAPRSNVTVVFRVFNFGSTVARDVQVTFDPPIEATAEDDPARHIRLRYEPVIPHLNPGQALNNTWQTFAARGKISTAPDACTVTIKYKGSGRRTHTDTYTLQLDAITHETESVSSDSELGAIRRIAKSLEALVAK
ncbi:hypothetical protein [Cellulomonas taurus]|uniref:hypothetical protein n=1 Tax=Cellulomonas taurus TaxID=2729175 RepID=UPI00145CC922|nr:hypothetical protein [Cellulomonas taurus]